MVGKRPQKCTVKQVLAAIETSGGIKTSIARKLKISRFTVDNYEKKYPTIRRAIQEERDVIHDKAESNIFERIQNGDLGVSQWYLNYVKEMPELNGINVNVNATAEKNVTVTVAPWIAKKIGDALVAEAEYEIVNEAEENGEQKRLTAEAEKKK